MRPTKFDERFARPMVFEGIFATPMIIMIWYYHAMLIMSKDTLFGWLVSMVKHHQNKVIEGHRIYPTHHLEL